MVVRRPFRFSISAKILVLALGLAWTPLLILSVLGLSGLRQARDSAVQSVTPALRTQAEDTLSKRVSDKAQFYSAILLGVQQQVESTADYTSAGLARSPAPVSERRLWISPDGPSPESERRYAKTVAHAREMIPILQAAVDRNPLVSLAYIGFEEGGVSPFSKDIVDVLMPIRPFDVRERTWYKRAKEMGKTVWVDPYIDANTKQLTTTCATPIFDQNNAFVGVVGFDMLLDDIKDDLLKTDIGGGGSAFLINNQGQVLVRPEFQRGVLDWEADFQGENLLQSGDAQLRLIIERMTKGERGVERLELNGPVYLAFAPIASAGLSVGIVVPEAEIIRPADEVGKVIRISQDQLMSQVLLLSVLCMVTIPLVGAGLSVLLARPLRQLTQGAQRVAAGDLNYRLDLTSHDEIGELVQSFNQMTDALRLKMVELEENLGQLALLNHVSNSYRATLSLVELLPKIPRSVCEHFGFDRSVLYLVEGSALRAVSASFGPQNEEEVRSFLAASARSPIRLDSETVEADIVRSGQAVIVNDPWNHPRVMQSKQRLSQSEGYVQVPIIGREDRTIGVLSADYFYTKRPVTPTDAARLLTFAGMVGLAIENTRLHNDLERQVAQRTQELREALALAQQADKLKGQFLASVSHELRTPLNAIIGFSTLMLDELDGPITEMQREDLKTINENGRFLLHMINDLLDLARIEAGHLDLEPEPLDMAGLMREVGDTVQGLLVGKPVRLRLKSMPDLPPAYGDRARVRQVLLNLLSNAVKFTEQGEIVLAARTMQPPTGPHTPPRLNGNGAHPAPEPMIAISVRDTGVGIAPEDQRLIFEEFQQVSPRRHTTPGTGLGLAITRRLVEGHGGQIWVESTPGQGSVFTFTLPICRQPAIAAQPQPEDAADSHTTGADQQS
ncbi:MAG TPA: ATP-binding protein [Roseiflexaceae bacterium]|nr:ATP-binding protein [Roseiflexaceae bacterium]